MAKWNDKGVLIRDTKELRVDQYAYNLGKRVVVKVGYDTTSGEQFYEQNQEIYDKYIKCHPLTK